MPFRFNPFTGNLDLVDTTTAAGSNTQIQFNDSGSLAGDVDLTWNKTTNVMTVAGDVNLSDGGSFTTTLQTITPTANRTVSIPDATGTLALVAGSSGQLLYNNAGANAGVSTFTADSSGRLTNSASSASGFPVKLWNGTIFAGTTPHVLIQPSTASPGSWSASGTALGVNAASGFAGNLLDLQLNGSQVFNVERQAAAGKATVRGPAGTTSSFECAMSNAGPRVRINYLGGLEFSSNQGSTWSAILNSDGDNTLAQRNGTSAQVFRVYNTYTSSTNYELGKLEWSSNAFRIGTEKGSGGGTARNLELQTDGITRIRFSGTEPQTSYLDAGGTAFVNLTSNNNIGIRVANGYGYTFTPSAANANAPDAAFVRDAAAVVKVTDGSTGNGTLLAQHRLTGTAPATASSTGTAGDIRYDADYIYVCTATNTWKRAALATW